MTCPRPSSLSVQEARCKHESDGLRADALPSGLAAGPRWDTQADGKAQQDQGGKRLDMGESSVVSEECFGGTMGIEAR